MYSRLYRKVPRFRRPELLQAAQAGNSALYQWGMAFGDKGKEKVIAHSDLWGMGNRENPEGSLTLLGDYRTEGTQPRKWIVIIWGFLSISWIVFNNNTVIQECHKSTPFLVWLGSLGIEAPNIWKATLLLYRRVFIHRRLTGGKQMPEGLRS